MIFFWINAISATKKGNLCYYLQNQFLMKCNYSSMLKDQNLSIMYNNITIGPGGLCAPSVVYGVPYGFQFEDINICFVFCVQFQTFKINVDHHDK